MRGKAHWLDGEVVVLLLDVGDLVLSWLVELVARVWREEQIHEDWKVGEPIILHKKRTLGTVRSIEEFTCRL